MQIEAGLFDNMVLQRSRGNRSAARFSGVCSSAGRLEAAVSGRGRKAVAGFGRKVVGGARNGRFSGVLKGLPAGGPYEIRLRILSAGGETVESVVVRNVLVGDVWVLAGQSNMEGIGRLEGALKPISMVRAFYMRDEWDVARDPIHVLAEAVDRVHFDLCGGIRPQRPKHIGVGPGVPFAQEMFRRTHIPQGLIACAHGGTSMSQWSPKLKRLGGRSLYGALLRRVKKNGGLVAGVLWYQGESDASSLETAGVYTTRMKELVAALRRDLKNSRLPFVAVQLAAVVKQRHEFPAWNSVQDQQRRLPAHIPRTATAPAIDLELDDLIHVSGFAMRRLGRRLAQAMHRLADGGAAAGKPPMEFKAFRIEPDKYSGAANVVVTFANVMGRLTASGRPSGFAVTDGENEVPVIYRTDLSGDSAILRCVLQPADLAGKYLYYGFGLMPYCNITDEADRSLPVFGGVPLGAPLTQTPFVRRFLVSRAMPSAGKLESLEYPQDKSQLQLRERVFPAQFADIHLDLFSPAEDLLVYYQCVFECAEPMKLDIAVGYDGPLKAWVDGRQVFHDPAGVNPATPDKARIPYRAKKGRHELLLALGSNSGRAWGIHLRFMRTDAPREISASKLKPIELPVLGV